MQEKVYCCIGTDLKKLRWDCDEQRQQYLQALENAVSYMIEKGFSYFISGGTLGVDTDFAETVVRLREKYPHIRLEIVLPCRKVRLKGAKQERERFWQILFKADFITALSQRYTPWAIKNKNRYLIDKANVMLAVPNGKKKSGVYAAMRYAKMQFKYVDLIELPPLIDEYQKPEICYFSALQQEEEKYENWQALKQRLDLSDPPFFQPLNLAQDLSDLHKQRIIDRLKN